jgi:RNA polymerase sigma factor (sigma-70 family)
MATDATIGGMKASASTDPTDAALVESAQGGNRTAFAELFERHRHMLVALCRRALGGSQAIDDVVQDAALAALLGIGTLRDPERFGPWLSGIGLNICRRWQRERWDRCWSWEAVAGGVAQDRLVDPRLDPAEVAAEREFTSKIRGAVEELPPGQRDAVALFYFSGLTQREMAVLLGTEVGAVKARLHKARKSLRQRLWSAWKEEEMGTVQQAGVVRMRPGDVLRLPSEGDRPAEFVIMLEEVDGRRRLPIWVGQSEAIWLAMALEEVELPRPGPYAATTGLLSGLDCRVREVRIERLVESTYYAVIVAEREGSVTSVDARPSDALNLAVLTGSPILVAADVVVDSEAGRESTPTYTRLNQHLRDGTAASAAAVASEAKENWEKSLADFAKHEEPS